LSEALLHALRALPHLCFNRLAGFLVWGEVPELWLLAGAAVIVGSSLYMIRAERRR
jgi:drug/metabolite transporter (DMT)-like permease